ncbi:MAG: endolytic transglycosylase MltG [Gammaproteobacteria bacterium]|nr:endolytic transglycosylase MltG [Gammaproteobacteria bacterium]
MHLATINKASSRLLALAILLVVSIWVWTSKDMLVKEKQIYHVNHGASIGTVAKDLGDKKWINSELLFNSLSKLIGANKKLQSGYYQIDPNMGVLNFLENISSGNVVTTKVTLIEGKTLNHYFEQLSSDSSLRSEDTLEEVMQSLGIVGPYDGWFYPETYQFNYGESVRNVLARSFQVMQEKVNELWENRDKNLPFKSPYEAIILASLIEKETALNQEKSLISGVFIRRLEQGMRLQTDPTVIYALGDSYQAPLKKSDLKVDSLYNTYKYNGLPPGAISSVGYESLYAAFHPDEGSDLYFVSKKDGSHAFASNYEEHRDNIKRYSNNI